jgi:outer membrane receptor protein involved in Fe transport
MKKHFFLLTLIISPVFLFAQNTGNVKGIITDANSKLSIPGVNIVIKETTYGTATNDKGYYELLNIPAGNYKLTTSIIGYEKLTKKIKIARGKTKNLDFKLNEFVQNLKEVQIIAKSEAREIQEQAIPVSVITVDDIQGTVSNVSELLSKTSGIKIRNTGGVGSASRISIRGLEGKRIGFFIDGTPLSDQSDFIGFNDIPLDMIERIEIYKGIVPAKFGGSSIGGAVNLVIKEYPPKYIDIAYGLQSYNTHNASAVFKRSNQEKGYEYGIGGFYTYSDNNYTFNSPYNPDLKNLKRDHDIYEKKVIAGGFTAKKWWFDKVVFEPFAIFTKKEIQGITHNIQEAVSYANAFGIANDLIKEDFLIEGLDLDFGLAYAYTVFKFEDKAMQRYNWDGTTYGPVTALGGEIGFDANDAHNQKHTVIQRTNLNYIINKNSSLNLNMVYNYAHGIPKDDLKDKAIGYKSNYESKMNSFVTGLNYEINFFNHKLTNSTSVKHYYYDINTTLVDAYTHEKKPHHFNKNDFGFTNAIRYRFTTEFLVKASYAYDVRLPSENELLGDGFITVPAGNLEPERNNSINLGFMYDHTNKYNNRLQLELNIFYMKLENMIRFAGGFLQAKYENFGEMETFGIDADIKYDLTHFLYIYANATYQDLRDIRKKEPGSTLENPTYGDRMPNIPYMYANAGFELHKENLFGGSKQNSKLYLETNFIEEYFYDFEQSIFQERRIPRSTTFNMGLEHSFKNKNITIGVQINNITDEKMMSIFNRPLPGRTAGIKLRYIIR